MKYIATDGVEYDYDRVNKKYIGTDGTEYTEKEWTNHEYPGSQGFECNDGRDFYKIAVEDGVAHYDCNDGNHFSAYKDEDGFLRVKFKDGVDVCSEYMEKTIDRTTGNITVENCAKSEPIKYKIYGNSIQDIYAPNNIQSVGDEVVAGDPDYAEHAGEYRIPIFNPKNSLPDEYQQIEYIQTSGTQYIDTLFAPSNNTSIEIKAYNGGVGGYLFGAADNSKMQYSLNMTSGGGNYINIERGARYYPLYQYSNYWTNRAGNTALRTVKLNKTTIEFPPYSAYLDDLTFKLTHSLYLCAGNNADTLSGPMPTGSRIYYCRIWNDDGVLTRDFVPCYRKSDGTIGLYDLCGSICSLTNSSFYTNAGSGTFIKGDDIPPDSAVATIYLNEPLRRITYNGTEIAADYVDWEKQAVIRNIYVLDNNKIQNIDWSSSESVRLSGCIRQNFDTRNMSMLPLKKIGATHSVLSNMFQTTDYQNWNNDSLSQGIFTKSDDYASQGSQIFISLNAQILDSETGQSYREKFNSWIKKQDIQIFYQVEDPIAEQVTLPDLFVDGTKKIKSTTTVPNSGIELTYCQIPQK